jgi:5-methylcytosine-specific restriction endonuclease McrA
MDTKHITIQETKKEIKPKQIKKRKVTELQKWKIMTKDSTAPHVILTETNKTGFVYQQIKNKLHSYRFQDIEKQIFDPVNMTDLSGVLCKLTDCNYTCYYCKEPIMLLYENVREPKQWTLERINNKLGHITDNVVIACLSCNLRRKTMKPERYILTKNIKTVVKHDSSNNHFF